jgi:hypothetical protein
VDGVGRVELAGVDHLFFAKDSDRLVAEIREFLTSAKPCVFCSNVAIVPALVRRWDFGSNRKPQNVCQTLQ